MNLIVSLSQNNNEILYIWAFSMKSWTYLILGMVILVLGVTIENSLIIIIVVLMALKIVIIFMIIMLCFKYANRYRSVIFFSINLRKKIWCGRRNFSKLLIFF